MTRAEAAQLAQGNPRSFLHVGRPDIDVPPDTSPYDPAVYAAGRAALDRFLSDGTLRRETAPVLYLYALDREGRTQVGLVGCLHIDDYERDLIRKHERTRPDKEDDRTRHVKVLRAHAEPIFLAYRDDARLGELISAAMRAAPETDITAADGVRHRVWVLRDPAPFVEAFGAIPLTYVADGHHRTASAWRAGVEFRGGNSAHTGDEEYNWFLAVLFPSSQLQILAYNRTVAALGAVTPEAFLAQLGTVGAVTRNVGPVPDRPGSFRFYLRDVGWVGCTLDPASIDHDDPIASLDASLLQDRILGPLLGISDQRTDARIDFVGGARGTTELVRRVEEGEAALAISMYPTSMDQLLAVADAGAIMPPKSTWFEPKLKSGLFVHTLDD